MSKRKRERERETCRSRVMTKLCVSIIPERKNMYKGEERQEENDESIRVKMCVRV